MHLSLLALILVSSSVRLSRMSNAIFLILQQTHPCIPISIYIPVPPPELLRLLQGPIQLLECIGGTRPCISVSTCARSIPALPKSWLIDPAVYPHFDIYPVFRSVAQPLQVAPDAELQPEVALLHMAKQRPAKTHRQLHDDVFVKGVVWTPSGYVQDLALSNKPHKEPSHGLRRQPSVREMVPRLERSRSGTLANQQTPSISSLRARQFEVLPNAPPTPPLWISSSRVLAVSGSPMNASQLPTSHVSQIARPSSLHRQSSILSRDSLDFTGRSRLPVRQAAQGHVLQRARAYEQSTGM